MSDSYAATALAVDPSGADVAGFTNVPYDSGDNLGSMNPFLRRYDADGNVLWTRIFGSISPDYAYAAAEDGSGGLYVAGSTKGSFGGETNEGGSDAFVRRYDADGNVLWTRIFGSSRDDSASALAVDDSGGLYVAGSTDGSFGTETNTGSSDAFVRRYDGDGNVLWTRIFGSSSADDAAALAPAGDGVYVAGSTNGSFDGGTNTGRSDAFVRRIDANGTVLWTRIFGSSASDEAAGLASAGDGVYVTGLTNGSFDGETNTGGSDAFVRRFDPDGQVAWTRIFGSSSYEAAYAASADSSGMYVSGSTEGSFGGQTNAGGYEAFVRRYGVDGSVAWTRIVGDGGSGTIDLGRSVAGAGLGGVYVAGDYDDLSHVGDSQAFVRRYISPIVVINEDSTYSTTTTVTIDTWAATASEMEISQSDSFADATWQPFAESVTRSLGGGDGTNAVFVRFRDADGNVSETVSDSIVLDTTPPDSSVTDLGASQPTATFDIDWPGTDATSGIASYDVQVRDYGVVPPGGTGSPGAWTDWQRDTTETSASYQGTEAHRYCFRSRAADNAGNIEKWPDSADSCTRVAVTTPPTADVQIVERDDSDFTNSGHVHLVLHATSPGTVSAMEIGNGADLSDATWEPYAQDREWDLTPGEGARTVYCRFKDDDGNVSSIASASITVDTTAPDASLAINDGALSTTSHSVRVTVTATDDRSGISLYRLSSDGTNWLDWTTWNGSTNVEVPWTLAGVEGSNTVYAEVGDAAGNVSLPASAAIDLDSALFSSDYGVSIDAGADFTGSRDGVLYLLAPAGVGQMEVSNDGGFFGAAWEPFTTHKAWTLADPHGNIVTKSVYVRYRAEPGSETLGSAQDDIVIDPLAPAAVSTPVSSAVVAPEGRPVATIDTRARDQQGGAGVRQMRLSASPTFAGAAWQPYASSVAWPFDSRSAMTVYVEFRDGAGNVSSVSMHVLADPDHRGVVTQIAPHPFTIAAARHATFLWAPLGGAKRYELQVSSSSDFATPLLDATTQRTHLTTPKALPLGKLFWRVRAASGTWSPAWAFGVPKSDPVRLLSPQDQATTSVLGPSLRWSGVAGAVGYQLQLAPDPSFLTGVESFNAQQSHRKLVLLARNVRYWWRVRPRLGAAYGPWSTPWSFKTPLIDQVQLLQPAGGTDVPLGALLDWTDATGARGYRVEISTSSTFGSLVQDVELRNSVYRLTGPLASGTYYWRVRAVGRGKAIGAWSELRQLVH